MDYFKDFLVAKTWALLHDPPNKAWLISYHRVKHEEYAAQLFREIFPLKGAYEGLEIPNRRVESIVKTADVWASSFDRWMILHFKELSEEVVKFQDILNIFDPIIRAYRNDTTQEPGEKIITEFVCILRSLLEPLVYEPVLMYHVLFSSLEYVWGRVFQYVCPADTRFPTHTIFDHLYATASMVNWFLHLVGKSVRPAEAHPKGYLVYIDIPGIQQFVNAARKTADYWAGSWLASYVAWYMVEELIEYLGPDILVLPTARHNLMYKQWLIKKVQKICDDTAKRLRDIFGDWYVEEPHPVMPATLSIVLPKLDNVKLKIDENSIKDKIEKLNNTLSKQEELRKYFENRFKKAFNELIGVICRLDVEDSYNIDNIFKKIFTKLENILKNDHIQPPRIVIIDVENIFDEYINDGYKFSEKYLFKEEYDKVIELLNKRTLPGISKESLLIKLFYHILFSKVLKIEILRHKIMKKVGLPLSRSLIKLTNERYRSKIHNEEVRGLDDCSVGWRYCTVCGQRPAVISFPRDLDEYDKKICVDILEKSNKDEECVKFRKKISVIFKPGEHLCTMCLLKRVLRKAIVLLDKFDIIDQNIDSNEYIANAVLVEHVLRKEFDREKCEKAEKEVDVVISDEAIGRYLACTLIRREFSYDIGKILAGRRGTNEVKRILKSIIVDILRRREGEISSEYIHMIRGHESPRMYYAIVKGDGDSMGKLIRGKLSISSEEYFRAVLSAIWYKIPRGFHRVYREVMSLMCDIANALGSSILISPAYHASLSAAMMVTAIKDAEIVKKNLGLTIYAGGDDIAALCPVETFLKVVAETRRNYWACQDGFHRLHNGGVLVPALVAYGRSYGVRLAHVMDPMQAEIAIASEALEDVAKDEDLLWKISDVEFNKDTLAVSYGRTSLGELENVVRIPLRSGKKDPYESLREVACFVDTVKKLWDYMLNDKLSHGLPMDFENMYRDAIRNLVGENYDVDTIESVVCRLVKRNVSERFRDILDDLMREFEGTLRVVEEKKLDNQREITALLVEYLFTLLRILRTFPK
ncbi:MAG: type III-B CRISPR-associated protein Cas10/Cmr2 [Crenarchaeota archaeon]|nr:type III-B CRISPR-associated protein Cas10/Cmr2 [Thermoproteota archaeon]